MRIKKYTTVIFSINFIYKIKSHCGFQVVNAFILWGHLCHIRNKMALLNFALAFIAFWCLVTCKYLATSKEYLHAIEIRRLGLKRLQIV